MENKKEKEAAYRLFLITAMSTAALLVTPVLLLAALGYFLDGYFHTSPVYLLLGIGIGFVSGIHNVFRILSLLQKRKKKQQK